MTDEPVNPHPLDREDPQDPTEYTEPTTAPPPPPDQQPGPRRLVRDPYSRLGGVASGVAQHYGFDVSLVRIAFVLVAFGTGFGFLAYLLAWMIIPRADHWPPAGPRRPFRSLTKRDLGLGMAVVGLLAAIALGGGTAGSILVPLVLVGGGVWLLIQPAARAATPAFEPAASAGGAAAQPGALAADSLPPIPPMPLTAPGPPVPPRSRRRRVGLVAIIVAAVTVFLVIPVLVIGGVIVAVATGNFGKDAVTVTYSPDSVSDLPLDINFDAAEVTIDLTGLPLDDFDNLAVPSSIEVDVDFGQIVVLVPEGLEVSVEAEAAFGDVTVFDRSASGIGNDVTSTVADPDVEIVIDLGFGDVDVSRP